MIDQDVTSTTGRFHTGGTVAAAVLIVTYNSAADLPLLLEDLRAEARSTRLRVIVADNDSQDDSMALAAAHDDVIMVPMGGNLGYAAALNAAAAFVGEADATLVLNPDLRLVPAVIATLLRRLRSQPTIGAVVPAIRDARGELTYSLRREPTVTRAFADALLGRTWPDRPASMTEHVRTRAAYEAAHPVDWATGAALLVRTAAARSIGAWDERFFLFSEETDFQRRLRKAGWSVWFEPDAAVSHRGSGSGVSNDLVALTVINRVRYFEKHEPSKAWAFRTAVLLGEHLRRDRTHSRARWALRRRARWRELPHAHSRERAIDHVLVTRFNLPTPGPESFVRAREGWLRERVELFTRYTVPSVKNQTVHDFRWIVYLDPQSPTWLIDRLQPYISDGLFTPLYREEVLWPDVARDARELSGGKGALLMTTNLDNDDALAPDFVERLQALALTHRHAAIYLCTGLIRAGDELYLRHDSVNAFCSVVESWHLPQTAWRDCHTDLHRHFPVVIDAGPPAWLQVVHDGNVSNRIRGRRVPPAPYRAALGTAIEDMADPRTGTILTDRWVRAPLRGAKEAARSAAKTVILRFAGREGLDRVKERLAAPRTAGS